MRRHTLAYVIAIITAVVVPVLFVRMGDVSKPKVETSEPPLSREESILRAAIVEYTLRHQPIPAKKVRTFVVPLRATP